MSEFKKVVWHKVNVPVKHALINNAELGKVFKDQRADQQDVWQTSLSNPNFTAFASSFVALGIRVEDKRILKGQYRSFLLMMVRPPWRLWQT
ncbi:MAG: hypothetical protein AAGG59_15685 [Bacteroidota bacterium]